MHKSSSELNAIIKKKQLHVKNRIFSHFFFCSMLMFKLLTISHLDRLITYSSKICRVINSNQRKKNMHTLFVTYWVFKWWIKSNELTYICFIFFFLVSISFWNAKRTQRQINEHFYSANNCYFNQMVITILWAVFILTEIKNGTNSILVKWKGNRSRKGVKNSVYYNAMLLLDSEKIMNCLN